MDSTDTSMYAIGCKRIKMEDCETKATDHEIIDGNLDANSYVITEIKQEDQSNQDMTTTTSTTLLNPIEQEHIIPDECGTSIESQSKEDLIEVFKIEIDEFDEHQLNEVEDPGPSRVHIQKSLKDVSSQKILHEEKSADTSLRSELNCLNAVIEENLRSQCESQAPRCQDCEQFKGCISVQLEALKKNVGNCLTKLTTLEESHMKLLDIVTKQNVAIMEALASQNVKTDQLIQKDASSIPLTNFFPIESEKKLEEVENQIFEQNYDAFVSAVRSILRGGISKNLQNIFNVSVIIEFNLDGTHGKKRLKTFKNFFHVLLDAIDSFSLPGSAEEQLRKALQLSKKRHFKKSCLERQSDKEGN